MQKYIYENGDGVTHEFVYSDETRGSLTFDDDGSVVYACGGRKTKFTLADCQSYREEKDVLGKSVIFTESDVDIVMLAMMVGEQRLMRNNDVREIDGQWRFEAMTDKDGNTMDMETNVEEESLRNIETQKLRKGIARLQSIEQEIINMYIFEGYTQREIAEVLDIDYENVKKKYQRSLKSLKKWLKV